MADGGAPENDDRISGMLVQLRDAAAGAFVPPDLAQLQAIGVGRRRHRVAAAATAITVVALTIGAGVGVGHRLAQEDPAPAADTISEVDWNRTELSLPPNPDNNCPSGKVRMHPRTYPRFGTLGEAPATTKNTDVFQILPDPRAYGDLTGDGRPEAVLHVRCATSATGGFMVDEGAQLLVVTLRADHSLAGLAYVGPIHAKYVSASIMDHQLVAKVQYSHVSPESWSYSAFDVAYSGHYAWNGSAFTQVSGRKAPLVFVPQKDAPGSPVHLLTIMRGAAVLSGWPDFVRIR